MKVLRADQYATIPWRNGGGTTREIAVHRDPSLHDDFLWRLSIATITRSGPFSGFDGVDRTIAVLTGQGMTLRSSAGAALVTSDDPPLAFKGETSIFCEVIGGGTIDLNAMTRRGFYNHTMRRERIVGWTRLTGTADKTYVVSNASLELSWQGRESIQALDTIADISPGTAFELYSDRPAEIFVVELTAR